MDAKREYDASILSVSVCDYFLRMDKYILPVNIITHDLHLNHFFHIFITECSYFELVSCTPNVCIQIFDYP